MNENCLVSVYYIVSIIAAIIASIGVIVTIYGLSKYLRNKTIDALLGFYSRLQWNIHLLKKSFDKIEQGLNVLYCFCEDVDICQNVPQGIILEYKHYREEIINLCLSCDNQINIKIKNVDYNLYTELKKLIDLFAKYRIDEHINPMFNMVDQREAANKEAKEIVRCLDEIDSAILKFKKKYKVE